MSFRLWLLPQSDNCCGIGQYNSSFFDCCPEEKRFLLLHRLLERSWVMLKSGPMWNLKSKATSKVFARLHLYYTSVIYTYLFLL